MTASTARRPTLQPAAADIPDGAATDWEAAMRASLAGDARAYAGLLRELDGWLRRYYRRRLPHGLVDDTVQEALIAVHEKRHTYEPGRPVMPWVAAIARYKWIDRLRAMRERDEPLGEHLAAIDPLGTLDAGLALESLLARLKPAQAEAIRLVKLQGFSVAEASRMTGQSESLVKVNIHRGLATLSRQAEAATAPVRDTP
jgi:RNA polymerase sigma-70 factor (ECF subfamily)